VGLHVIGLERLLLGCSIPPLWCLITLSLVIGLRATHRAYEESKAFIPQLNQVTGKLPPFKWQMVNAANGRIRALFSEAWFCHAKLLNGLDKYRIQKGTARRRWRRACVTLFGMTDPLGLIDAEIATLQQARAMIVASDPATATKRLGRPSKHPTVAVAKPKRKMSPEGRARLAASLKARWAAKKAAQ
jgi:hypothetical protein